MRKTYSTSGRTIFVLYFLFLFFVPSGISFAQSDSAKTALKQRIHNTYIDKLDTVINIKLSVNNEFERFRQEVNGVSYDIRPNISLSTKLSFSYRYISFGFGFKPKFIPGNNDNDKQGKTKAFTFGFDINANHIVQSLKIGYVRGFYLNNSGDFDPTWNASKDPYLIIPDLKVAELMGSTFYKLNSNFSFKAISSQTEIQRKSCGSLLPGISYMYYEVDNKSDNVNQTSSQKTNNFELLASVGYFYSLVINRGFYAAAGFLPGIGYNFVKLTTRLPNNISYNKYNTPVTRFQEKFGLGYNSRKWYSGAELSLSQSRQKMNYTSVELQATRVYFQVFVGYHFTAPRFIKKQADAIKNLAPEPLKKVLN